MKKIKQKIVNFFKWIWTQIKDWHNLIILIIVAPAFFCLCVLLVALGLFFIDGRIHIIYAASLVVAFWVGPFTPFWPLCIAITLGVRKFIDSIWKPRKLERDKANQAENDRPTE